MTVTYAESPQGIAHFGFTGNTFVEAPRSKYIYDTQYDMSDEPNSKELVEVDESRLNNLNDGCCTNITLITSDETLSLSTQKSTKITLRTLVDSGADLNFISSSIAEV